MEEYVKNRLLTDLEGAKEEFKDYWYSWSTFGGNRYEGVIMFIEDDDYHIICTDGVRRVV